MSSNNEIQLDDLPSPEELLSVNQLPEPDSLKQPEAPGMPEAFARAMAQGASFGFSDEITAKIKSMFKGTPYEKEVEKERANYKAAEEQHPMTSMVGEVAGGMVPAMAAAPLAAASGLSKLARGVGLVGKMGLGAAEGAATGALYGAGKSDETTNETGAGAKLGAVVGGAIPVVGKVLGGIGKAMKSKNAPEALHDVAEAFDYGKKGQGLVSSGSVEGIKKGTVDLSKEFSERVGNQANDLGRVKEYILQNSNKTVNVANIFDDALKHLQDMPETTSIVKKVSEMRNLYGDELPLKVANELAKDLRPYTSVQKDPTGAPIINKLVKDLTDTYTKQINSGEAAAILKNAPPEIQEIYSSFIKRPRTSKVAPSKGLQLQGQQAGLDDNFNDVLELGELPLKDINENISHTLNSSEMLKDVLGNTIPSEQLQSTEKVARFIRGMDKVSDSGEVLSNRFKESMAELRKANPILADELEKRVKDQAKLHHLSASARGVKTIGEGSASGKGLIMGTIGDIGKAFSVAPANVAGQAYTKVSQLAKAPERLLATVNARFGQGGAISKMVDDIVANPDENKRRAGINSLMQISAFREMMKEEDDNGEADR